MTPTAKELFKAIETVLKGKGKLLRKEDNTRRLIERGFDEAYQTEKSHFNETIFGEPSGIFYARTPKDMTNLIYGKPKLATEQPNVVAYPIPEARTIKLDAKAWEPYMSKNRLQVNEELKRDYDFVEFPDLNTGQKELYQTVQLNPEKAVAQIKDPETGKLIWKLLSGIGAVGASESVMSDEAEASPLKKPIAGVWKQFISAMRPGKPLSEIMKKEGIQQPAESRAMEVLKGQPFRDSIISGVYRGPGKVRYIHLEDGKIYPTDTASVHNLAAEYGTQQYIDKFAAQPTETNQILQMRKSYRMNEDQAASRISYGSQGSANRLHKLKIESALLDRQGMTQLDLADQVMVTSLKSGKSWLWPRVYAELGELEGLIKIDKKWKFPRGK